MRSVSELCLDFPVPSEILILSKWERTTTRVRLTLTRFPNIFLISRVSCKGRARRASTWLRSDVIDQRSEYKKYSEDESDGYVLWLKDRSMSMSEFEGNVNDRDVCRRSNIVWKRDLF